MPKVFRLHWRSILTIPLDPTLILMLLRLKLQEKFSTSNPRVKLQRLAGGTWEICVRPESSVVFSLALAALLNVPTEITNTETVQSHDPVQVSLPQRRTSDLMYFINCDRVEQNFITPDGERRRVLDCMQLSIQQSRQKYVYMPATTKYCRIGRGQMNSLSFSLTDFNGHPVYCDSPELLVLFHIRPCLSREWGVSL